MISIDLASDKEENKEPTLWWECEHCGKLIPYMAYFCSECSEKLLGEPPKPVDPPEREENNDI